MRVAFFGGSFDPPHVGHVLAAAYALCTAPIDRVLFVPVRGHALHKPLSAFEHRVAMTELAAAGVAGAEVSRIEAELPTPNFTLNTLHELQRRHPDWQLRLMIGSDVFAQREKWQAFDEVVQLAPPLLLARSGFSSAGMGDDELGPSLLPEVSSSTVRALLNGGKVNDPRLHDLVPRTVLQYIEEHGLYRG